MNREEQRALAQDIVSAIVDDLRDRAGLQNAWDDIDKSTQDEILETWAGMAYDRITDCE